MAICKYCGREFSSERSLLSLPCSRHPAGPCKGKHTLYEGSLKSEYTCRYCGRKFRSIMNMTALPCLRHPNGSCKGKHSPAL